MTTPRRLAVLLLAALALVAAPARATDAIPDVEVQDQTGRTLHFRRDLLDGHVVAVNFIFTSCSTICPQLGATSAALARELAARHDDRLRVISISFDPGADTPARLRAWGANFGDAPGWTLVTGRRREIETLLRALEVYVPDKALHSSSFLLGNAATGEWRRIDGSATPVTLASALAELAGPAPAAAPASRAAATYFPDTVLIDQDGRPRRFYSDLLKGRIVVIDTFFSDCGAVCPIMAQRFAQVQTALGDRVGRDVFLLSITVDPVTDTPEKLRQYARAVGARPGWEFLTGDKASVSAVLRKLGQYVEVRDAHSNLIIVGNEPTGLWKKAFGLADPAEVVRIVESVANDGRP